MTKHHVDSFPSTKRSGVSAWPAVLVLAALAASGCGRSPPILEGIVTLDGEPIDAGTIELFPADGKGPTAGTGIKAGRYRMATAEGPKKVWINSPQKDGTKMLDPGGSGQMIDRRVESVPARYHEKTGLEITIKPGRNTHDFTLEGGKVGKPQE